MWVANMILCVGIGFGSFCWAIWRTLKAEEMKKARKA